MYYDLKTRHSVDHQSKSQGILTVNHRVGTPDKDIWRGIQSIVNQIDENDSFLI